MAQVVNYYTDNVTFTEGPFVACSLPFGGSSYRVEVEQKEAPCSVVPDWSIQELVQSMDMDIHSRDEQVVKQIVDILNLQVRHGIIVLQDNNWVTKKEG